MFESVVSINGTPRSGSSWLGQLINSSEDVRYKFQPFYSYEFRDMITERSTVEELHRFFNQLYDSNDWYLNQKKQYDNGLIPKFTKKEDNPSTLVFKSVRKHYILDNMISKHPLVKVICIIRDPIACMNSWVQSPTNFKSKWNFDDEWLYAKSMNGFMPSEYYGYNKWKEANQLFLYLAEKFPDKVYIIRYEELVNDCHNELKKIFDFIGISFSIQTENFIRDSKSKSIKHEYSVYRNKRKEIVLKESIINKILNDINGSDLERFLSYER